MLPESRNPWGVKNTCQKTIKSLTKAKFASEPVQPSAIRPLWSAPRAQPFAHCEIILRRRFHIPQSQLVPCNRCAVKKPVGPPGKKNAPVKNGAQLRWWILNFHSLTLKIKNYANKLLSSIDGLYQNYPIGALVVALETKPGRCRTELLHSSQQRRVS